MAKIIDEKLILEIKPEVNVNGWIEYTFNFLWDGKPIFNPQIMADRPIRGDEISRESLVSLFEEAVQHKGEAKAFFWSSDDPDIELGIKAFSNGNSFDVEVFFNDIYFKEKENEGAFGGNPAGVRTLQNRNELIRFSKEFRNEYEASLREAKTANPEMRLGDA